MLLDALANDAASRGDRWFGNRGGFGRYTWRYRHMDKAVENLMLEEAENQGDGWRPVADGLFGGDSSRAIAGLKEIASVAAQIRSSQW